MDKVKFERVIATGANSLYFGPLINLLGSIFLRHPEIDAILVYDLGMSFLERMIVKNIQKVVLKEVPPFCPHYLEVEHFAWKTAAICDALENGQAVLWLDAGAELQTSIDDLFVTIETDGCLFCISPVESPNIKIGHLSHARSLELLDADNQPIRNSTMVNAGVIGFLSSHSASEVAFTAMKYAANPEIIKGPRTTHRHDQTIYSVLRVKKGYIAQFYFFLAEKIRKYPFLIRASSQDIVLGDLISSWNYSQPHIFLIITRTSEAFAHAIYLKFKANPKIFGFFLNARMNHVESSLKDWIIRFPLFGKLIQMSRGH